MGIRRFSISCAAISRLLELQTRQVAGARFHG
jgi:hypothetical protein